MKLAIIGAGAAGYFHAAQVAECAGDVDITLLEASSKTLSKVRISGGGRCNVTHDCPDPAALARNYPRGHKELRGPFNRFGVTETKNWFEDHGVPLKTENDGRVFPSSNDSASITDCLERTAREAGVKLETGCAVKGIKQLDDGRFSITTQQNKQVQERTFDAVFLATGGTPNGFDIARSLGHNIVPPVPSLFTFNIQDPLIEGLAGISIPAAEITLPSKGRKPLKERGPMLITHWGLSGPVVLKLSAWAARTLADSSYNTTININFVSPPPAEGYGSDIDTKGHNEPSLRNHFELCRLKYAGSKIYAGLDLGLPRRLTERLLDQAGVSSETLWSGLPKKQLNSLVEKLLRYPLSVTGKSTFKEEFVTCGGVSLKEINFKTFESRLVPGLYMAGEVLDIDGITGGFNFQNAWTGARLAAEAIAET